MTPLDSRAWTIWMLTAATLATLARHPLYSLLILLAAQVVGTVCAAPQASGTRLSASGTRLSLGRLAPIILLMTMGMNLLFVHMGSTVLFRLPDWPLIGGVWTAETAVAGLTNGLVLLTLLVIFQTFNRVMSVSDLAQLTPRALHELGLVLLIALTYVPETAQQLQRIREAQAIRGHQLRGLRDWPPLVIPLLIGGLERAMSLAETMVARGYGATDETRQSWPVQLGLIAGLGLALIGWLLMFWHAWLGWLTLAAGVCLVGWLVWRLGQQVQVTRYRPRHWQKMDSVVVGTAVAALLFSLFPHGAAGLTYAPYPTLTWPPFAPTIGLGLLLLATPATLTH